MIGPEVLLPIGGVVLAYALSKKKKKTKKKKRKPRECPPFSVLVVDEVLATAQQALASGLSGVGQVSSYVGQVLYPKDKNLQAIPWPKAAPWELPATAPEPVVCLYAEIKVIVADIPMDGPIEGPKKPGEILTDLLSDNPTLGKYYLVKQGNVALGKNGILSQALNAAVPGAGTSQNRLKLLRLMTTPKTTNWDLYSRTKFTNNWPAYTGNEGRNLGAAWLPRHKSAISAIASGQMPQRNIDLSGNKAGSGSSYGLVWIPPLDIDALKDLGVVTDAGMTWDDGTTVLNPPPELLQLLAG